jgi:four helix bundle protein
MNQLPETKGGHGAVFDHEKLEVYQLELHFIAWVTPLLDEVKSSSRPRTAEVSDQLDRASLSALLNTAEGNGKRQRPVRAKFFDDARGSATECAGCLDALVVKGVCTTARIGEGKALLIRIVSILTRLIDRFDSDTVMREDAVQYRVEELAELQAAEPIAYEPRTRRRTRTRTKRKPR